jgi:urease accessory protein
VSAGGWTGRLELRYRRDGGPDAQGARCVAHDRHHGPLRVLRALYPEGPGICHHVLVHPPGGIVGGDELDIDVQLDAGTHALITTPGATRFYRSAGAAGAQRAWLRVADGARLEWLPLESIAHSGCRAHNAVRFELAPGGAMIGWDLLALGLPAAGEAFDSGTFEQRIEWPGRWLERGRIDAADRRLFASPLGLAGHGTLGTAWFACGAALAPAQREALVEAARAAVAAQGFDTPAGATSPDPGLVLLRVLAQRVEPAFALFAAVRAAWRRIAWQMDAPAPRIWRT